MFSTSYLENHPVSSLLKNSETKNLIELRFLFCGFAGSVILTDRKGCGPFSA